ncbi:ABC transporter permease [soil metagenome]
MWRATIKGLIAHKLRLALTSLAVVLGVAFVAGTFILTDTLNHTFDSLFTQANAGTDVVVRAKAAFTDTGDGPSGGGSIRERIPEAMLASIREVDGVAAADGVIPGFAQLVDEQGEAIQGLPGAPVLGVGWSDNEALNPLDVRRGRAPVADGEVAIDAATARENGLSVGDRVQVILEGPSEEFTIVGIVGFGVADNLGGATLSAFEIDTAQRIFNAEDGFDQIAVAAEDGVSPADLRRRIAATLPGDAEAVSGQSVADENAQEIQEALGFFNIALLVFAGVSLFVGAFIIFNTFQIIVAQRTRELALLRALGASRSQVTRLVVAEAFIVGVVSSAVGIALGFLVAVGLQALLKGFGLELPTSDTQFLPRTVLVSVIVGVGTTFVASVFPAVRASRVAPVEAMRAAAPTTFRFSRARLITGVVVTLIAGGVLMAGLFGGGSSAASLVGLGAMLTFLGVAVLSPLVAAPIARFIGAPLSRLFATTGKLGRENAMRNPKRTASTAAALMIGLGLVAFVTIFGDSVRVSAAQTLDETLKADFILSTEQFTPFTPQVAKEVGELPEVAAVADFRYGVFQYRDQTKDLSGVDPSALDQVTQIDVHAGSVEGMRGGGILVFSDEAELYGWQVGDRIAVRFARTGDQDLSIAGIYGENRLVGDYLISLEDFEANFTQQLSLVTLAKTAPTATPEEAKVAIEAVLEGFPNVQLNNQAEFKEEQANQINQLLGLVSALLGLAILIAFFGIVNTLALSIFERTREIGLLRAVGMSRRQVRAMIRSESVIIAVLGALLGIAIGLFFGWALVTALADEGISHLAIPGTRLAIYVGIAAVLGILAAVGPARRAAKIDVLSAIGAE